MAAGGMFLVVSSFLAGTPNIGLLMAFGGALSVAALIRAIAEKRDGAMMVAVFALAICAIAATVGLAALAKR